MGIFAKIGGWLVAHKDALYTGYKVFTALRGRRKATEESGESFGDYYKRNAGEAINEVVRNLDQSDSR